MSVRMSDWLTEAEQREVENGDDATFDRFYRIAARRQRNSGSLARALIFLAVFALLLILKLSAQTVRYSVCGPTGAWQLCGVPAYGAQSLGSAPWIVGQTGGAITFRWWLPHSNPCHQTGAPRTVVLFGSAQQNVALLPGWLTNTGDNLCLVPVWVLPMAPTFNDTWHRSLIAPPILAGYVFHFQCADVWVEQNVGMFAAWSQCVEVTF